ncbi:vWA domain-containing protein [Desertivirga arenae]|uniref:vWA domain-containing protein n=1 Tax=Desertivirga arenae TaxID=2810309 RepID=UPI001A9742AE|nr:vWA domain-containing protein [Pedobacter sp. SYSU D00823]
MAYLPSVHMPFLFQIQFTSLSGIWVLLSLMIGLAYAFLLYTKKSQLPEPIKRLLFTLRTIAVALITFLLLAPLIRTEDKTVEKPLIFLLLDNSASITASKQANFNLNNYNRSLSQLIKELSENYEVKALTFGSAVKPYNKPSYTDKVTNIGEALSYINDRFANRNIGAVILASDGIYNRGSNPQYEAQSLKSPVYTIALGDTVPRKDLLIANVNYNNIVYLGNDFQIEVELEAYQSKGSATRISITDRSGQVFDKSLPISTAEYKQRVPVTLSAKQKGIQKYTVNLSPVQGELSKENNTYSFFVEVIDGRQKVLILANSPHPDIAAIKQSIETNKNYEVKVQFAGSPDREDIAKSNLLILHQLPSQAVPPSILKQWINGKNALFIVGEQTNISAFSSVQDLLTIVSTGNSQEAYAKANPNFYDFVLSEASKTKISHFPPLITPFGNYTIKTNATTLFSQQIGKVATDRPLLIFSEEGEQRSAVLAGEGIWRWRLEDFKENGSHQAVDELLTKTVQFISSKEDKRKFRVYAAKNTFDENEHIILNAELYNNAYELINSPEVSLNLVNNKGKTFSFQFSRTGNSYVLDAGTLPFGEYTFTGTTRLGNNKYKSTGRFMITRELTELRQTTANHQILYNIAKQSNGELVFPEQIGLLKEKIKNNELVKNISYENRRYEDMINLKWLFFVILFLLSLEWLNRKRNGEL